MRPEVFHEFNPDFLLLPELQVTIDRGGNDEVRPADDMGIAIIEREWAHTS